MIKHKIETITVDTFETKDGQTFKTLAEAETHEATLFIRSILDGVGSFNRKNPITRGQAATAIINKLPEILTECQKYSTLIPTTPKTTTIKATKPVSLHNLPRLKTKAKDLPIAETSTKATTIKNTKPFFLGETIENVSANLIANKALLMEAKKMKLVTFENNRWILSSHGKGYLNLYRAWLEKQSLQIA